MASPATFGEWVRRRRKALDLTQKQLAEKVGCSTVTITKIEAGERKPSCQIAQLLCQSLELGDEDFEIFVKVARGERSIQYMPSHLKITTPGR